MVQQHRHEVKNDQLDEKAREARREYQRTYYAKNKQKVQAWQRDYWARRATKGAERKAQED